MPKTLGAITFCIDPYLYDYNIEETVHCLRELADQVIVVDAGSSKEELKKINKLASHNVEVISISRDVWDNNKHRGKYRISEMQNLAKSFLDTDYYILLQADEVISSDDFDVIRDAIETDKEGFYFNRINLWGSCNTYINVPEHRQPCSTVVGRLAKIHCDSVDDGESISIQNPEPLDVNIFHMGFVRKVEVMKAKVENMQSSVFGITPDPKLYLSDTFDSTLWFKDEDLSPLQIPLPNFIKSWASSRP